MTQDRLDVAGDGRGRVDMGGSQARVVDHVDDLGVAEPAEGEAEVERRADHDHQVGLGLEQAPGAAEGQLVVGGQAPPAQPVDEGRHPQALHRLPQLLPSSGPVDVGAGDQGRAVGGGDEGAHPVQLVGVDLIVDVDDPAGRHG